MSVSFGGIGEVIATFECENGLEAGACVKMTANGKVAAAENGERFFGVAVKTAADNCAAVHMGGFSKVKYSGAAPAVGYARLVSDGNGGVKTDSGSVGGEYLIAEVDTGAGTVSIWM